MSSKAKLKWNAALYQKDALKVRDAKELRAEYSRLRDIAMKRLSRLGQSEFAELNTYKEYKNAFPKLKDIKTDSELRVRLQRLAKFVTASTSTVSGLRQQRAKQIATLHRNGYTFVNEENFQAFTEWVGDYIDKHTTKRSGSPIPEVMKDAFEEHMKELDPEEVKKEYDNREIPKKRKERSKSKRKDSSEIKKLVRKERERQAAYQKPKTESKEIKKMIREQRKKRTGRR